MIERFEPGKRYRFSKQIFTRRNPDLPRWRIVWVNECDGKEVTVVSREEGMIGLYGIFPQWCEVIEND